MSIMYLRYSLRTADGPGSRQMLRVNATCLWPDVHKIFQDQVSPTDDVMTMW